MRGYDGGHRASRWKTHNHACEEGVVDDMVICKAGPAVRVSQFLRLDRLLDHLTKRSTTTLLVAQSLPFQSWILFAFARPLPRRQPLALHLPIFAAKVSLPPPSPTMRLLTRHCYHQSIPAEHHVTSGPGTTCPSPSRRVGGAHRLRAGGRMVDKPRRAERQSDLRM